MAKKIECLINNYWPLYYGFKAMPVSLIDKSRCESFAFQDSVSVSALDFIITLI